MIPHAGYVFSMPAALRTLAAAGKNFSRVIIIGPSHRSSFPGVCAANFDVWETPFGDLKTDPEAMQYLRENAGNELRFADAPHIQEHSIEVELPLIRHLFGDVRIVPLLAGQMDLTIAGNVGKILAQLNTPETLWVISGDFTHYGKSFGYTPFGVPVERQKLNELDRDAAERIAACDIPAIARFLNRTQATICGINPAVLFLKTMAHAGVKLEGTVTELTDSGVVSGDYNHVVGYAGIIFKEN